MVCYLSSILSLKIDLFLWTWNVVSRLTGSFGFLSSYSHWCVNCHLFGVTLKMQLCFLGIGHFGSDGNLWIPQHCGSADSQHCVFAGPNPPHRICKSMKFMDLGRKWRNWRIYDKIAGWLWRHFQTLFLHVPRGMRIYISTDMVTKRSLKKHIYFDQYLSKHVFVIKVQDGK